MIPTDDFTGLCRAASATAVIDSFCSAKMLWVLAILALAAMVFGGVVFFHHYGNVVGLEVTGTACVVAVLVSTIAARIASIYERPGG